MCAFDESVFSLTVLCMSLHRGFMSLSVFLCFTQMSVCFHVPAAGARMYIIYTSSMCESVYAVYNTY